MQRTTRWALLLCVLALIVPTCAQARHVWQLYKPSKAKHTQKLWLRGVPDRFVLEALCVHAGWHWKRVWPGHVRRGDEWLESSRWYRRTWNIPDGIKGGTGEATWHDGGAPYYNGMQFAPSTWDRAGGHPSRLVSASPAEQVYRAYRITGGGRTWGEWPWTARACGLL